VGCSSSAPGALGLQGQRGSYAKEGKMLHRKPLFTEAADVIEQLKKSIGKKRYDVTDFYWTEGCLQAIARHQWFEHITFIIIAVNALWISIDADLNTSDILLQAEPVFIVAENVFCTFFACELGIRFGAFKNKRNCLKDVWFVFDTCLVIVMVLETWVVSVVVALLASGSTQTLDLGNATLVRMLRLLRLSRVARMARLLRSMPEIIILIKGMVAAVRSVFFTLLLLVVLLYVFAIVLKQASIQTPTGDEFFSTVPRSMNKLIVYGIFYDGVGDLVDSIVQEDGTGTAVLLLGCLYLFVLMASLTVMNMLIGVLCEVVSAVAKTEHEEIAITYLKDNLSPAVKAICQVDEDITVEDVKISKQNFLNIMRDQKNARLLEHVEVDIFALIDLVDTIFEADPTLPVDEEPCLTFQEFIEVMLEHRSTENCTVKDITDLRKYIRQRTERFDQELGDKIDIVQAQIQVMSRLVEQVAGVRAGTLEEQASEKAARAKLTAGLTTKLQVISRLGLLKDSQQAGRHETLKAVRAAAAKLPTAAPTHRQSLQTASAIAVAAAAAQATTAAGMGDPPRPAEPGHVQGTATGASAASEARTLLSGGTGGGHCASDETAAASAEGKEASAADLSSRRAKYGKASKKSSAQTHGTASSSSSGHTQSPKMSMEETQTIEASFPGAGRAARLSAHTTGSLFEVEDAGEEGRRQEKTDK